MLQLRRVPSAALTVTFILLTHTGLSLSRSLGGLDDSIFTNSLDKRNSWWSKKSVPMDSLQDYTSDEQAYWLNKKSVDSLPDFSSDVPGCYVASCVPEFIACARRSRTRDSFDTCKLEHRACAMHCWQAVHQSSDIL